MNEKLARLSIEELQAKYGGKNWGIKTEKDCRLADAEFSLIANRRIYEREFQWRGLPIPTQTYAASIALQELIAEQNELRKTECDPNIQNSK